MGLDAGWESGIINGQACGLEAARQRFAHNPNYSFQQSSQPSDLAELPGQFDVGVCMETLEHVEPSKVEPYISAFARKLAGPLFVTVPNEKGFAILFKTLGAQLLGVNRGESYTASEFVNAFLGRMEHVPRTQHKGFDYTALAKLLERRFRTCG